MIMKLQAQYPLFKSDPLTEQIELPYVASDILESIVEFWHLSDHHSNTQQSRLIPNSNTEPTIIPRPLQSADLRKIIPLWKVCFVDALTVPRIVAVALVEIVSLKNVVTRFCFKLFLLLPLLLLSLPRPLLLLSNIFFPLFSIS